MEILFNQLLYLAARKEAKREVVLGPLCAALQCPSAQRRSDQQLHIVLSIIGAGCGPQLVQGHKASEVMWIGHVGAEDFIEIVRSVGTMFEKLSVVGLEGCGGK